MADGSCCFLVGRAPGRPSEGEAFPSVTVWKGMGARGYPSPPPLPIPVLLLVILVSGVLSQAGECFFVLLSLSRSCPSLLRTSAGREASVLGRPEFGHDGATWVDLPRGSRQHLPPSVSLLLSLSPRCRSQVP